MAGGDRTTRGFLDGWDPDTGQHLWRRYTIPAPGEPGSETWPNKDIPDAWKYGGGATWQNGSYDPELDLVYWGTGNAEPYNPAYRGGLDSLYTASVLAIRPEDRRGWFGIINTCRTKVSILDGSAETGDRRSQHRRPEYERCS